MRPTLTRPMFPISPGAFSFAVFIALLLVMVVGSQASLSRPLNLRSSESDTMGTIFKRDLIKASDQQITDNTTISSGPIVKSNKRVARKVQNEALDEVDFKIEKYPFHALLWNEPSQSSCIGVIVGRKWILVRATCLYNRASSWVKSKDLRVSVGVNLKKKKNALKVNAIYPHPKHDRRTSEHNIALVRLQDKLQYSDSIQRVRLAKNKQDKQFIGKTNMAKVSEWLGFSNTPGMFTLSSMTIVSDEACSSNSAQSATDASICARREGSDRGTFLCPLESAMLFAKGQYGWLVLAFSKAKGRTHQPCRFLPVSLYYSWICETIKCYKA